MTHKRLLIIWHSRTGGSRALAEAAAAGARAAAPAIHLALRRAEEIDAAALLASHAFLFVAPENLASLSGAMKEMFDRTYYACLGQIEGRPYATIICAGSDGTGAQRQLDRIATGWRLRRVADPMIVVTSAQTGEAIWAEKVIGALELAAADELGAGLAAGLDAGVF
jgi:NAD(P)H-dependent FMN reductase